MFPTGCLSGSSKKQHPRRESFAPGVFYINGEMPKVKVICATFPVGQYIQQTGESVHLMQNEGGFFLTAVCAIIKDKAAAPLSEYLQDGQWEYMLPMQP